MISVVYFLNWKTKVFQKSGYRRYVERTSGRKDRERFFFEKMKVRAIPEVYFDVHDAERRVWLAVLMWNVAMVENVRPNKRMIQIAE
jgi:hypothetical protein